MLRTKWMLQLRAKQYKQALATGEELVKADTGAATLDYLQPPDWRGAVGQQCRGAYRCSRPQAAQKFPNDASFPLLLAQSYAKAGQSQQALPSARRATEIDPKNCECVAVRHRRGEAIEHAGQRDGVGAEGDRRRRGQVDARARRCSDRRRRREEGAGVEGARGLGSGAQGGAVG